ncbi:MAG: hypothetical protein DI536_34335 [Archangium gephyra]|uniref:Uncharacterized protein n=1 Tax=Archangium gephyra TaxID=48 RepID=A0A2W5U6D7_9BACT|nr:MAG: hypothetical protein DI536_34335 [Archangium gephyra]
MSSAGTLERFTESVGPIVVKEVRQGLRARVFAIFFGILLSACFAIALVAIGDVSGFAGATAGRGFFASFITALGCVTFFVIPFTAFRSMVRELEDETWVLLTLTGLGAHSITRGKWVSAMSQSLLFSSACAPYVLFSYFLNGVDIVQLVSALLLAAAWSALLTALAIAIATQAESKLGRTLAHFVVLGALGLGAAMGIGFAWLLSEEGQRIASSVPFRNAVIGLFVFSSALTWLLLQCAAAGLALPSENAAAGPRRALFFVVMGALAFGVTVFVTSGGRPRDALPGQILICMFLALCSIFASSERDGWPRQAATGGLLKAGAERSFWLMVVLVAASTAVWGGLWWQGGGSERELRGLLAAAFYPLLYMSLGVIVGRLSPLRRLGDPRATRVAYFLMLTLGVVLSVVFSLVVDGRVEGRVANSLNPLIGMVNFLERSSSEMNTALVVCGSTTVLALFLAALTLRSRDEVRT